MRLAFTISELRHRGEKLAGLARGKGQFNVTAHCKNLPSISLGERGNRCRFASMGAARSSAGEKNRDRYEGVARF